MAGPFRLLSAAGRMSGNPRLHVMQHMPRSRHLAGSAARRTPASAAAAALEPALAYREQTKDPAGLTKSSALKNGVGIPLHSGLEAGVVPPSLNAGKPVVISLSSAEAMANMTPEMVEGKRQEILADWEQAWAQFDALHSLLAEPLGFFVKHEELRHPPIFYIGHCASFYVNKLVLGGYMKDRIDPQLELQTAVGVDEMSWDDMDASHYVWPSEAEARADPARAKDFLDRMFAFRERVRSTVREVIMTTPLTLPVAADNIWWTLLMGIEHERVHLETSSVILRQAKLEHIRPMKLWAPCPFGLQDTSAMAASDVPKNAFVTLPTASTRLGRPMENTPVWGWDNEFADKARQVEVEEHQVSRYLVSNGEYLEFVRDGGYANKDFWTEEGWSWVKQAAPEQPRFWVTKAGEHDSQRYFLRTMTHEIPMPWDWPAEVSNLEAGAFCKWKTTQLAKEGDAGVDSTGKPWLEARLPTELEYLRMRDLIPTDLQDSAHGPAWLAGDAPGNVNLEHYASACPVTSFAEPTTGICDILGNVWQHNQTPIDVLPGFKPHPLYEDFTTPTVDGLHARIMGGSFVSSGANGGTRDSRFGFRRHFYQHAGFRYVRSGSGVPCQHVQPFVAERELANLMRFHLRPNTVSQECYPVELAKVVREMASKHGHSLNRVMELGCGVGRTALELASSGSEVHAADRTAKMMQLTQDLIRKQVGGRGGCLRWHSYTEGEHSIQEEATLSSLTLDAEVASRLHLHQFPDWGHIDTTKFHSFDCVVAAQPDFWLASKRYDELVGQHSTYVPGTSCAPQVAQRLHQITAPRGLLVTGATDMDALQEMEAQLPVYFEQLDERELTFAVAETARKHRFGLQALRFWRRKDTPAEVGGVDSSTPSSPSPSTAASDSSFARASPTHDANANDTDSDERSSSSAASWRAQLQDSGHVGAQTSSPDYEDLAVLDQYLDFHFGPPQGRQSTSAADPAQALDQDNYCKVCSHLVLEAARDAKIPLGKALEVGGGPGRAAFELAAAGGFSHVVGTDFSQTFVQAGERLRASGSIAWDGRDGQKREIDLSTFGADVAERVHFQRLDACGTWGELSADPSVSAQFDLICGFNLIDRLPSPDLFLRQAGLHLKEGGLLILSSPYTWLEQCTPKEKWIGGYKYGDNDGPNTYCGLSQVLTGISQDGYRSTQSARFEELKAPIDVPFVIRDSPRSFQRTTAQMTFWRKMN